MTCPIARAEVLAKIPPEQLLAMLQHLPYATGFFDSEFRYIYYNPAGEKMSGVPLEQARGKKPGDLLPPLVLERMMPLLEEVRSKHVTVKQTLDFDFGQGTIYLQLVYVPMFDTDGNFNGILGITQDVTRETNYEIKLTHQANHDALTGIANRNSLRNLVATEIERATGENRKFAFFFLDLDNFKNVNDFYGHAFGDTLLIEVAKRLAQVANDDHLARIGGDEFVILKSNLDSARDAEDYAATILATLRDPFHLDGHEILVTTSIGVAFFPDHGSDMNALLKSADMALYKAKAKGKGLCRIFSEELSATTSRRLRIEHLLKGALGRGEMHVAYQPIAAGANNQIIGAEALLRWNHPELGSIGPDEFIPIAENAGLMPPITDFVLKTACAAWQKLRGASKDFYISVNLSPVQFQNRQLVKTIAETLKNSGLEARLLQLEITETVFLDGALETVYILDGLHELGVRLALDDFGTGYSSLNYLTRFPFDCLKIDKSFIHDIATSKREYQIAKAIVAMANALGFEVVAEGIESKIELDMLMELGCERYQGYLLSRPVTLSEWRWG